MHWPSLLLPLVVIVACGLLLRFTLRGLSVDVKLSAVEKPGGEVPFLGHALKVTSGKPWSIFAKWCLDAGGKIVRFNVMGQRVLYVAEPALLKRVLQTQQRIYKKDVAMSYKQFMCILGNGLVTSEGEKWRKGRLLLSHALRIDLLSEVPLMAIPLVNKLIARVKTGDTVDLCEEYRHLTLQVIGQAALSFTAEESDKIFPQLYLPIVQECNLRVWEPWRAFMPFLEGSRRQAKCLKELDRVICDTIRNRWRERQSGATGTKNYEDILDRCMSQLTVCDEAMVEQLRDDVKTMLLAGHETSAALLTWATLECIVNPKYGELVAEEAQRVLGPYIKSGELPPHDITKQLKWTPAVLRETLRKHSVVPLVMRTLEVPDVMPASETGLASDLRVPTGVTIAIGIEAVHNRADLWPEPQVFRPERFYDDAFDKIDPFAFIPFISGPRNCLGQHVSLIETQLVLGYVFATLELSTVRSHAEALEHHNYEVPQVPKFGLQVRGKARTATA